MSSPAMRMEDLVTMPPREMTATSLVPPPTSTTIDPCASLTGRLAPIAAASGSSMVPGVRPSMRFAADPTATTLSVLVSIATTEGSQSTIPCPLTNTSVFAVPRSIATSRPKSPPNIRDPSSVSNDPWPPPRRLEYSVLLHTKVPVAQDHVIQDVDTDYLGGLLEPPGDLAVLAARSYLAAGVVVG